MSAPDPRFEVPPEYAEVYERAYRRAVEDERTPAHEGGSRHLASGTDPGRGRFRPLGRGTLIVGPVVALLGVLVVGAFVLGMLRDDQESAGVPVAGGSEGSAERDSPSPSSSRIDHSSPARVLDVSSTCTADPSKGPGWSLSYRARNTVDGDPTTAWRCNGLAVDQVLSFELAPGSRVVQVGLVPGAARSDRDPRANRITRVSWRFGDAAPIEQTISAGASASMRTVEVPTTSTDQVRLTILGVAPGVNNQTAISAVQIWVVR